MKTFYAARKCIKKTPYEINVIAYIPSKINLEEHLYYNKKQEEGIEKDYYLVSYPYIKTEKIKLIDKDIVDVIFDTEQDCLTYCNNLNNFIWEPYLSSCKYEDLKSDIELIATKLKQSKEKSMEQ